MMNDNLHSKQKKSRGSRINLNDTSLIQGSEYISPSLVNNTNHNLLSDVYDPSDIDDENCIEKKNSKNDRRRAWKSRRNSANKIEKDKLGPFGLIKESNT